MKRALIAGSAYFFALFALGFALGTIRVLYIVPRFGELAATLAEAPVMIAAAFFFCRWSIRRWQVPPDTHLRWAMAIWFLVLLIIFEILMGTALFGRTMSEQWARMGTPAGLVGLTAQFISALLPVFFLSRRPQ